MKKTLLGFGFVLALGVFFISNNASAATVKIQPLNNIQFLTTNTTSDYAFLINALGIFATGTVISGIQVQYSEINKAFTNPGGISIYEFPTEAAFTERGSNLSGITQVCSSVFPATTDESGFASVGCSATLQGFPYFYAVLIQPSGGANYNMASILGSDLVFGSTIYYDQSGSVASATSTGKSIYYQLYSGSSATQYFTPDPSFAGFATSSVATLCDNSFATSTGFLDSVASSISNGLCRVGAFLFVPSASVVSNFQNSWSSLTTQSFPFSWITDTRTILEGYVSTTTENFPTVTIGFGTSTEILGFSNLEVISTSTISYYLSDSIRTLIKTLLATMFYLLAIGYIYRNLQGIWNKQQ